MLGRCLLRPGSGAVIRGQSEPMTLRRMGVEEELLLIEPETGQPQAVAGTVLGAATQIPVGIVAGA